MSLRSEVIRIINEYFSGSKKITDLPDLPSNVANGDLFEVVRSGTNYKGLGSQLPSGGGGSQDLASVIANGGNATGLVDGVTIETASDILFQANAITLIPLSGVLQVSGNVNVGGNKVVGLDAASANGDAVRYEQLTDALAGIKWKSSARVATTVAGTLATSFENGDTIDGVVLATGDRILIKDQADQTENGIYVVAASGDPTRSTDADLASELQGAVISVEEGTTNADTTWRQTTDSINLGVSNIVWSAFGTSVPDSSETVKGIIEIATQTEVTTGTDDVKAVTPLKLTTHLANNIYSDLDFVLMNTLRNSYNY